MILDLITRKTEEKKKLISVREAYNLWDILKSKYYIVERLEIWEEFIHDKDLHMILAHYLKELDSNIKIIEKLMYDYAIMGPPKERGSSDWAGNTEATRDEFVGIDLMTYFQEHIENLLKAYRTSVTNDKVRTIIGNMLKRTVDLTELLYKYLKVKGWIDLPPLYPNIPAGNNEKICCGTASNLWDHLTIRYDNLRETKMYVAVVSDLDFKLILNKGIENLESQSEILEKECKYFGITLPKQPPEVIVSPQNTEVFSDEHMYRRIMSGLQELGSMHAQAIKQCTVNDRVRGIFKRLLIDEIEFYDKFIKYGKLKGWLNPAPAYEA